MGKDDIVINHYKNTGLLNQILLACDTDKPSLEQLKNLDEFHIGRSSATEYFVGLLELKAGMKVLDAGCGAGGAARHTAVAHDVHVTGIDLTPDFIDTAKALSSLTGLEQHNDFVCGSVTDMPFDKAQFDAAYTMHVGMNVEDKVSYYSEVRRVLKSGGIFGVYDIFGMQDKMKFPMPWSSVQDTSYVLTAEEIKQLLCSAGFEIVFEEKRRDFALDSFVRPRAMREAGTLDKAAPPVYMADFAQKTSNLIDGLDDDACSPWVFICR